jgi:hypothetical protein
LYFVAPQVEWDIPISKGLSVANRMVGLPRIMGRLQKLQRWFHVIVVIGVHYTIAKLNRGNGYMREWDWMSLLSFNVMIAKYPTGASNPHNENPHARFLSRAHR